MSVAHKLQESPAYDFEGKSFIEVQFPIAKLSKESYKERKAVGGQTLTGLGKWWGRKPLILVRASIIGCLMPASKDPEKDRDIFLKILIMDDEGLWIRKNKVVPPSSVYQALDKNERNRFFPANVDPEKPKYQSDLSAANKKEAERLAWPRLSYEDKLKHCVRPEEIEGPSDEAWQEINTHLGTSANSIGELVQELGKKKFGHVPRVGDAFCGGGSVPFEAARIGCEAYASDLNPVAALLTWGALNIVGADKKTAAKIKKSQEELFNKVDQQITDWGIEHNEQGWRADVYLYCNEANCPECGWEVPLSATWVISDKNKVIAKLNPVKSRKSYDIEVLSVASKAELKEAKKGTVGKSGLCCPNCETETPIRTLRGDRVVTEKDTSGKDVKVTKLGLRMWENDDIVPRENDIFRERLYCIRWQTDGGDRVYQSPTKQDLRREEKVMKLLNERFHDWQKKGFIPSMKIESGDKTDELMRTRGWTHWHHLFNPRQLLANGLNSQLLESFDEKLIKVALTQLLGRLCDWNSKLCVWLPTQGIGGGKNTFLNQALNALYNYSTRGIEGTRTLMIPERAKNCSHGTVQLRDARTIELTNDLWLTDPPYADAVNYHELSEFYLAWYDGKIRSNFSDWYSDSKRALAIKGKDYGFTSGMIDAYSNLAKNMNHDGLQIVMFTHQDAGVWADLSTILWASNLSVVSAWCIATETDSGIKVGNYVKGTVFLILKKRTVDSTAFLDELYPQVEDEVKRQIDLLISIDDSSDPNFGDSDYQLAAYAAALRVLTSYASIEDIDISEVVKLKDKKNSPITKIIEDAVRIATEYQVPHGLNTSAWKKLDSSERLYLKGLEIEARGEYRDSVYQELARGFGVNQYRELLASSKANEVRLKSPFEFARKELGTPGFGSSLVRSVLFAVYESRRQDGIVHGKNWLREELPDYWNRKKQIMHVLDYLASMANRLPHWKEDGDVARLLKGAIQNDHV